MRRQLGMAWGAGSAGVATLGMTFVRGEVTGLAERRSEMGGVGVAAAVESALAVGVLRDHHAVVGRSHHLTRHTADRHQRDLP